MRVIFAFLVTTSFSAAAIIDGELTSQALAKGRSAALNCDQYKRCKIYGPNRYTQDYVCLGTAEIKCRKRTESVYFPKRVPTNCDNKGENCHYSDLVTIFRNTDEKCKAGDIPISDCKDLQEETGIKYCEPGEVLHGSAYACERYEFYFRWDNAHEVSAECLCEIVNEESNLLNEVFGPSDMGLLSVLASADLRGNFDTIKVLLDAGAAVDARDTNSMTALHHAAQSDNVGAIKFLLEAGADKEATDSSGRTAVQIAAEAGSKRAITVLEDPSTIGVGV